MLAQSFSYRRKIKKISKFQFVELNGRLMWCDFGATLYRAILTIFTISNGTLKTPRDNLCGISCGANNTCRTPRIALQFSKVRIYFDIQKALLTQGFLCCRAVPWCRRFPLRIFSAGASPHPTRAVQFVKTPPSYLHFRCFMV